MTFLKLVVRNLLRHKVRTLLTVASVLVGIFLMVLLRSLDSSLVAGAAAAESDRLIVQSAVSLYVDLPLSYQAKIASLPQVESTCKWQWFGAYYQNERNQFGQFAVDPEALFDIYPEVEIVDGSKEGFLGNRRGCVVGEQLITRFDWKVGDTIPLIGSLFPHPDGPDVAWEFQIEAVYRPTTTNFDRQTLFFHWDYFEKTLDPRGTTPPGMGTLVLQVAEGVEPTEVMAAVDAMFENGPQRVQTTPEDEFQAQFISMFGNVPLFLASIGGAVLVAILLASVNTMLMAAREQTYDIGVMKALGFSDGRMFTLLAAQSMVLALAGGGLGIAAAVVTQPGLADLIAPYLPTQYVVGTGTLVLAAGIAVALGLGAGAVPALRAGRLRCVEALGSTE